MAFNGFRALLGVSTALIVWFVLVSENQLRERRAPVAGVKAGCDKPGNVAITFDEGPGAGTQGILNELTQADITATFHVVTKYLNVPYYSDGLTRTYESGHIIGLRFPTDLNPSRLSDQQLIQTLVDESKKIHDVIKRYPKFLRYPADQYGDREVNIAKQLGFIVTAWNIDANDYPIDGRTVSAESIKVAYNNAFGQVKFGTGKFISLHHDLWAQEPGSIIKVSSLIRNSGYTPVTMDICIDGSTTYRLDNNAPNGLGAKSDASTNSASTFFPILILTIVSIFFI